ncbi:MAG: pyrroline-5-carboxylate reductase [Candidatus Aerophobetes bacterium]|nr:pyrroline-5-carboxylate reductase [Candidatus Aerophobetes bacterium]
MSLGQKICFIGAGRMGTGLVMGILKRKLIPPQHIWACDKLQDRLSPLAKLGVKTSLEIDQVIKKADVIFIAVKPQDIDGVLESLRDDVQSSQLIISIAAGITTSYITRKLERKIPLIRVMPNAPALAREGISAISPAEGVGLEKIKIAREILETVGEIVEIPEELQDAVTGLSGSGPAYIYTVIEGLIQGGIKVGLNQKLASKLAIQTALGAAKVAKETGKSMDKLIATVASPGGITIKGLKVLEKGGLKDCLVQAVIQATQRAKELKK